ncbi:MAG: LacI family DNA-binding transcriptional regulator [Opitutae bacterium]|nr:LacI family DNA-binding transcriptional regulator [Opitutae bacterium]
MASHAGPSLREIAKVARVSHVTVSRALRNDPSIPPATARRLQRLAERLGYRPNPLVSALLSQVRSRKPRGDHRVIAYLNTWWPRATWESCNTKTGQYRGAERRATELGFRLENFWLREPGMTPARLAQILKARGIRGVLIGPLQDQRERIGFPWEDFTLATIGYSLHEPVVARSCHAHFRGMFRAMDELIARGYRRIGYITSRDFEARVNSLWGAAYRLNQHRLTARDRIEPLVFSGEAERETLERWLARVRPDAVIDALPGVFELLAELGVRAPADLGFAHLDLPLHLKRAGVTGIDQLWEHVGAGALELVANQLYTNTQGVPEHPVTQLIEGVWIAGATAASLAARPARAAASRRVRLPTG